MLSTPTFRYTALMPEPDPHPGPKPYHHGNLRAALLSAAEQTLRGRGVEKVSLRDLARQAGVSHAAPRRHFRDRQALLDALTAEGYTRLGDEISAALEKVDGGFEARLRAVGVIYVRFAVENTALLDLMLAGGHHDGHHAAPKTPGRPYLILRGLIKWGRETGELEPGEPEEFQFLILATFQGIAALVGSGSVSKERADALVARAAALIARP